MLSRSTKKPGSDFRGDTKPEILAEWQWASDLQRRNWITCILQIAKGDESLPHSKVTFADDQTHI